MSLGCHNQRGRQGRGGGGKEGKNQVSRSMGRQNGLFLKVRCVFSLHKKKISQLADITFPRKKYFFLLKINVSEFPTFVVLLHDVYDPPPLSCVCFSSSSSSSFIGTS